VLKFNTARHGMVLVLVLLSNEFPVPYSYLHEGMVSRA
jgi:hypothetical protein